MPDPSPIRVLNSLPTWLPSTSPWLFNQVRLLPPAIIKPAVVAEQRGAAGVFALGIETYLEDQPRVRQLTEKIGRKLGLVRQLPFYWQVAKRFRPHILHSHWGDQGWRDSLLARKLRVPHIVTYYGKDVGFLPVQRVWRERYKELFAHCALVLCEGPFMADRIADLGCPKTKIRVQRLGVVVDDIRFEQRKRLPGEPLRILLAASFREKKGLSYALEAIGLAKSGIGQFEVTIIGDSSADPRSVPEKQAILDAIARHELQPHVSMLGYQSYERLLEEAYRHHIFMSPSVTAADGDTEGGAPVTLIDMAAAGLLLISTTHCDIPQVITHGVTGLLAPERDPGALASHLTWLANHQDKWSEIATAGRERIIDLFDAGRQARILASIYADILSSSGSG